MKRAIACLIELNRVSAAPGPLFRAANQHRRCRTVCLVHMIASGRSAELEAGQRLLREAVRTLRALAPAVHVEARLEIGDTSECLLSVAQEINAELIVMGAHGEGDFPYLAAVGRVARLALERGRRPVLLVSPLEAKLCRPRRSGRRSMPAPRPGSVGPSAACHTGRIAAPGRP